MVEQRIGILWTMIGSLGHMLDFHYLSMAEDFVSFNSDIMTSIDLGVIEQLNKTFFLFL